MDGTIFDIQRYSIHDGPGIRTTVFFKGCPLSCKWCANPESQKIFAQIFYRKNKCKVCGKCVEICPLGAISLKSDSIELDRALCDLCMKCVDACSTHALSRTGTIEPLKSIIEEISSDELFYRNSGGGITVSGGEPLFQPKFLKALLEEARERSLHTAVDTCGFAKWKVIEEILDYTDIILFDLKHLDSVEHKKATGVGNELILENFQRIIEKKKRIWVRIPVIPGFNDSEQHIEKMADFLSKMPIEKVSLLAFHEWGKTKYKALGIDFPLNGVSTLEEEKLVPVREILKSRGLEVEIGR